jgi:hypothetical protein
MQVEKFMSELQPGDIIDRGNGLRYEVEKVYIIPDGSRGVVYVNRGGMDPLAPSAIYFTAGEICNVVTKEKIK